MISAFNQRVKSTGCARKLCPLRGTHYPVLLFRPKDHPGYAGAPMEIVMGILVCPQHQRETAPADLISDDGWQQIREAIVATGRAEPDRASAGLVWKRPEDVQSAWEPTL